MPADNGIEDDKRPLNICYFLGKMFQLTRNFDQLVVQTGFFLDHSLVLFACFHMFVDCSYDHLSLVLLVRLG